MNWSRVKTILILFFLCTNLFLVSVIVMSGHRVHTISDEIIHSTGEILKNNRILMNEKLIPKRVSFLPELAGIPAAEDEEWISGILGGQAEKLGEGEYQGEHGTLTVQDQTISFSGSIPLEKMQEGEANAIMNFMQQRGMDRSQIRIQQLPESGVWRLTEQVNEAEIFDQGFDLTVENGAVVKLTGSWLVSLKKKKEAAAQKNAAEILLDFVGIESRPQDEVTITSLEPGYAYSETLYPVWRISLSDGSVYLMDAREK